MISKQLVISGPTASGKSDLAIRLAKSLNGEIINADSVQVYKDTSIGSAKLSTSEQEGIPHHLLDICDPNEIFTAGDFMRSARKKVEEIIHSSKLPILVGGSTMYLSALLKGLSSLPTSSPERRALYEFQSNSDLFEKLKKCDSASAQAINENDRMRTIRALEVFDVTGIALSEHHKNTIKSDTTATLVIVLCSNRQDLYERINLRTKKMIEGGIIEETKKIYDSHGPSVTPLGSLGYAQCVQFLENKITSKDDLSELIAQKTRNFAKRQMTYWRKEPIKSGWTTRPSTTEESVVLGNELLPGMKKQPAEGVACFDFSYQELLEHVRSYLSDEHSTVEVCYINTATMMS